MTPSSGEGEASGLGAAASGPLTNARRVAVAVIDQGLVAFGTFTLNVLLARAVTPHDYGVFVLAYSAVLFAGEIQNALLLEPMAVFGAATDGEDRRRYLGAVLLFQVLTTGILMAVVWIACGLWLLFFGRGAAIGTVAVMALGLFGVQSREFMRRVFYACLAPERALRVDLAYLVLLMGGLIVAAKHGGLDAWTTFLLLAVSGTGAAVLGLYLAGVSAAAGRTEVTNILRRHWGYGRWMTATAGVRWASNELYYVIVGIVLGPAGTGALKALQNVFAPASLFLAGVGNFFLPTASRHARRGTADGLHRLNVVFASVLGIATLLYGAAASASPATTLRLLYDGKYLEYAPLLTLLAAGYLLMAVSQAPSLSLRALGRPQTVFVISAACTLISAAAAFPLAARWGLPGAIIAWLSTFVIGAPLWAREYLRAVRHPALDASRL